MNNDDHIPEGWAVPDDMSEWLRKSVNRKPFEPEDDLKEAIEDLARDIATLEPNPVDWEGWVSYMIEQLEGEAQRRVRIDDFEKMLRTLAGELVDRVENRK